MSQRRVGMEPDKEWVLRMVAFPIKVARSSTSCVCALLGHLNVTDAHVLISEILLDRIMVKNDFLCFA